MVRQSQQQALERQRITFQSQQSMQPYDSTTYFFHKYGSCFNQLQAPLTHTERYRREWSLQQLQNPANDDEEQIDGGGGGGGPGAAGDFSTTEQLRQVRLPNRLAQTVFDRVCRILEPELLAFLDGIALDVYLSGGVPCFPYKTVAESLNLVMVSMLREVVKNLSKPSITTICFST